MKNVVGTIGQALQGKARLSVIDAKTKKVIRQLPWQKNMITNYGMNLYPSGTYNRGWTNGFNYACAGTGTTPTTDDSGLTQATQVGTTVTLAGGSFTFTDTATDAGKVIKWDTTEEAMIVSVTSPTQVEVNVTQAVPAAEFTVYRTNQNAMATDVKRTATYVSGAGNCGTTFVTPASVLLRRTYDFSAEAGPITYNEIGLSHSATVGSATLFSRILLAVPLSLLAGQQLRLQYELGISYTPATPQARTAPITNWPVAPIANQDGFEGIETTGVFYFINTTGSFDAGGVGGVGEPALTQYLVLYNVDYALQPVPATGYVLNTSTGILYGYSNGVMTLDPYVPDSFTVTKFHAIPASLAVSTAIKSIGLMGYNGNRCCGIRFRFTLDQTKDSLHKLTIRYRWTWRRVF